MFWRIYKKENSRGEATVFEVLRGSGEENKGNELVPVPQHSEAEKGERCRPKPEPEMPFD